ncbi:MAG: UDP-2,3-diacylglucosamine diphosphatase [Neisseria sp.]|nr:UDP-2,3-diacylglucosamine diphosphatase [Neisseria sp.]
MRRTVFISDLHLSPDTPDLNALFARCLNEWQGSIDALYILGDLFDAWVGDDAADEAAQALTGRLKTFCLHTPAYFVCGNRDFLVGRQFAQASGVQLLPEQSGITLYGRKILLTHGDEMCTEDRRYQRYRRIIRNFFVKKLLLALPLAKRRQIAAKLRAASRRRKAEEGMSSISDVTEQGIQTALRRFPHTELLIHGHTHRPNCHRHYFDGRTVTRWVLPDWKNGQGGCLNVFSDGRAEMEMLVLPPEAV